MATWTITGTLSKNGDVLQDPPTPNAFTDQSTCSIDVGGNYNGGLVVEVCSQSRTWYPIHVWSVADQTQAFGAITGTGLFKCDVSSVVAMRVRLVNNTSGSATVTLYATPGVQLPNWTGPLPAPG